MQIPTVEEASLEAVAIGIPASEGESFWFYHEARGWMLGKVKMKSWKAALQTWKRNGIKYGSIQPVNVNVEGILKTMRDNPSYQILDSKGVLIDYTDAYYQERKRLKEQG